jgi:hypothetical protein
MRLFKESRTAMCLATKALLDTGYVGIEKHHSNSSIPHKKKNKQTKKNELTKEEKKENKQHSQQRVLCENVIGMLKRFRILAEKYRNQRRRFGLRFNLIAGLYNYEIRC